MWVARRLAPASDQSGFTLIELLVAASLLAVILVALLAPLTTVDHLYPQDVAWSQQVSAGQAGLQRMADDLRQATDILGATSNSVYFEATLGGQQLQVYYECDIAATASSTNPYEQTYDQCRGVTAAVGATLPAISTGDLIVDHVLNNTTYDPNDPVFTYSPNSLNPTYVQIKLVLPSRGSLNTTTTHNIVLNDGAYLHNLNFG